MTGRRDRDFVREGGGVRIRSASGRESIKREGETQRQRQREREREEEEEREQKKRQ